MALTLANSVNDMRLTINDLIDDVANLQFLSIGDIPDVNIDSITNNTVLVYNSDDAIFEPVSFNLVAGSNTQIQFNSDGSLGADANLVFDLESATLTVPNANVTQLDVSNVVTEDIQSNTVVATDVQTDIGNVDSLTANTVEVTSGNVDSLTANTLDVSVGNVDSLTANTLEVTTGNVDSLTANTLEVTSGNVDSLTANTLEVTTGNVDSLTANTINASGVVCASSFEGDGSSLTGIDLTNLSNVESLVANTIDVLTGNVDSLTANTLEVTTGNVDSLTANFINASGVVCASSFEGDGSNLTGVVKETVAENQIEIDYALIAGGGGGGTNGPCLCDGGGGGAGGIITHFGHNITSNTEYCVIIGAGGAACLAGQDSHFGDFAIARGGGEGTRSARFCSYFKRGGMGGSGGGGNAGAGSTGGCDNGGLVAVDTKAPIGATIHGSKGASRGGSTNIAAGGGGGAYCSPCDSDTFGGTGIKINLDGRGFYYGGGGSSNPRCNGFGGLGGGGDCSCCPPQDLCGCIISTLRGKNRSGAAHTGGGAAGRASCMSCSNCYLGAGGSGLLMIRYANTVTANLQSGATTFNDCGEEFINDKKVLRIITSGTITFEC